VEEKRRGGTVEGREKGKRKDGRTNPIAISC